MGRIVRLVMLGTLCATLCGVSGAVADGTPSPACTIKGTPHRDALRGTKKADVICGRGGKDLIRAKSGDDIVLGGDGDDELLGGGGDDFLYGEPDDDTLEGGPGDDALDGGEGANSCLGGAGDDELAMSCDSSPPRIKSLGLSAASVDTAEADQTITLTLHLTDDLAGVNQLGPIEFTGPGGQALWADLEDATLVSGDSLDGIYALDLTVPRYSAQGTWAIDHLTLHDAIGNGVGYYRESLEPDGLLVSFEQTSPGDGSPPVLESLSITPSIDSSEADRIVTVTAHITDDVSGLDASSTPNQHIWFKGPSRQDIMTSFAARYRVSGTPQDGIYEVPILVHHYAQQGTWTLDSIRIGDAVGSTRTYATSELAAAGLPTGFEQIGLGDGDAPNFSDFSFSPTSIDTRASAQTINVSFHMTDGLAGALWAYIVFRSQSGQRAGEIVIHRVSGNAQDGDYTGEITIPQLAECGTWNLDYVQTEDTAGNQAWVKVSDLVAAGDPVSFQNC